MQRQACEAVGQMLRPGPKPQPATLQAGITHHTAASLYMMVLALRQSRHFAAMSWKAWA